MAIKVFLNQLGQDVIDFIQNNGGGQGGEGGLLEEIISNITVGAAVSGTVFPKNQSLTDFAKTLLLTTITPKISTSFSNVGVKEIGTVLSGTSMSLTITNLKEVTVPINSINFYINNKLEQTLPYQDKIATYNFKYADSIEENTTAKIELVYDTNQKVAATGQFIFVYPGYHGVTSLASIDDSAAQSLISSFTKTVQTTKGLTWNNITLNDERFCYMYPSSFGDLSSIKDGNGFEQIQSYAKSTAYINNPMDGSTVKYNVYLLQDSVTGVNFTQIYS